MKARGENRLAFRLTAFYLAVILGISGVACYFAFQQRKAELLSDMDMNLLRLAGEYESITNDFWDIYIPIFQNSSVGEPALYHCFTQEEPLTPLERMELKQVLGRMAVRDDRIRWVAVFSGGDRESYIYFPVGDTLRTLPDDFPFQEEVSGKKDILEIYGERMNRPVGDMYRTIVMAGANSIGTLDGAILVGYDTTTLHQICDGEQAVSSIQFDIVRNGKSIFSSGETVFFLNDELAPGESGVLRRAGKRCYVGVSPQSTRGSRVFYSVDYRELFLKSHRSTPLILLLVTGVVVASILLYTAMIRSINREVATIRSGLEKIGENQLDYRIQREFKQSDFQTIADSINSMAGSLKDNIERVYYYKLRQREAELQELQAKFNPHFLYNSMEMFRARCYQNGDEETAELIAQTAAIFRGFLGTRTFIPIQEELAFSKRYLALLRARYGDCVDILYDVDTEVLSYGIIRNVLQPLIENYFVHGIDTGRTDNYIRFSGRIRDEQTIVITVEDNGLGVPLEELEKLNTGLEETIRSEHESYGLKNLNQRLRLFYGEGYGLRLTANEKGGLTQELMIGRWTCEDVEQKMPDT